MPEKIRTISKSEYLEHREAFDGYCRKCGDFTEFGGVEPDACGYTCPECDLPSVVGTEEALMFGYIQIGDEDR